MTNVSKRPLPRDVTKRMRTQLIEIFSKQKTKRATADVVDALLTDTERTMLAKRLIILIMLHNKCSHYEIGEALHVSPATIQSWDRARRRGDVDAVMESFKNKSVREDLLDTVEGILRAGMPPIAGRNRFSRSFKVLNELERKKRW